MFECICVFLQNLIKNLPEQKELSALAELKSEYEELCESEQFGVMVSSDFYRHRTYFRTGCCHCPAAQEGISVAYWLKLTLKYLRSGQDWVCACGVLLAVTGVLLVLLCFQTFFVVDSFFVWCAFCSLVGCLCLWWGYLH